MMNRDNNLGMWTRGPNDGAVYFSDTGPEYTDDMSRSTVPLPPSPTFTLLSAFLAFFCLLFHTITLTTLL